MAYVRRIPLNNDLQYLKSTLSQLLTTKIAYEYPEAWWLFWLEWGIEKVIYSSSALDYDQFINLDEDLRDAELTQCQIDSFKDRWLKWLTARLECCGLIDLNPNSAVYEYRLVSGGGTDGIPDVEFWFAVDPEQGELDALIARTGVST